MLLSFAKLGFAVGGPAPLELSIDRAITLDELRVINCALVGERRGNF